MWIAKLHARKLWSVVCLGGLALGCDVEVEPTPPAKGLLLEGGCRCSTCWDRPFCFDDDQSAFVEVPEGASARRKLRTGPRKSDPSMEPSTDGRPRAHFIVSMTISWTYRFLTTSMTSTATPDQATLMSAWTYRRPVLIRTGAAESFRTGPAASQGDCWAASVQHAQR